MGTTVSTTLRTPFFWRLFFSAVLLLLPVGFIIGFGLLSTVVDAEQERADKELQLQVRLARENLLRLGPATETEQLAAIVAREAQAGDFRLTLIDASGQVLADSLGNALTMDNHLQRPEVIAARQNGSGRAVRNSSTLGDTFHYYALPLVAEGGAEELQGYVRGAYGEAALARNIRGQVNRGLLYVVLILCLAILAAACLAYLMAARVHVMTRLASTIAQGNFERRIPVDRNSGLTELAQAINELARTSAQRVTEVTADRNRLAAIFAGMVEGVIDVDENQQILHVNEAAANLLRLNPRDCVNKPLWQEIRLKEITSALDQAMESRDVVKSQLRLSRESDELVVDIYAASLSTESGDPIGAVIVLNDITELENLSRVRTDFVANASHELKTPITAIRGLAETVLSDEEIDRASIVKFMQRIHSQSLRLSQLVSDLMAISRLESSHSEADFTVVNLSLLVKQAVLAAEPAAEAKQQALVLEMKDEHLNINGDRQNMSQLVDNLIDNAIKYTPEHGRIQVSLGREDGQVVLMVKDDGIGISHQYQQRVFERFYRVDKVRSQSLGGTGLGLSIVKNIVEKHDGTINLNSQPGTGSTFTVRIPVVG